MADPELASKLARRLETVDDPPQAAVVAKDPPPAPVIPQKVVPNPYVASDNSVSIDDLIAKTLERNERLEENNNVASSCGAVTTTEESHVAGGTSDTSTSAMPPKRTLAELLAKDERPPSPPPARAVPAVTKDDPEPKKQTPAPKTTIGELLMKEKRPLSPPPPSRCPIVTVQHHVPKPEVKRLSPEEDGSELERKLAAQRAKKAHEPPVNHGNLIFSTENASEKVLPAEGLESSVEKPKNAELTETTNLPLPSSPPPKAAEAPSNPTEPPGQASEEHPAPLPLIEASKEPLQASESPITAQTEEPSLPSVAPPAALPGTESTEKSSEGSDEGSASVPEPTVTPLKDAVDAVLAKDHSTADKSSENPPPACIPSPPAAPSSEAPVPSENLEKNSAEPDRSEPPVKVVTATASYVPCVATVEFVEIDDKNVLNRNQAVEPQASQPSSESSTAPPPAESTAESSNVPKPPAESTSTGKELTSEPSEVAPPQLPTSVHLPPPPSEMLEPPATTDTAPTSTSPSANESSTPAPESAPSKESVEAKPPTAASETPHPPPPPPKAESSTASSPPPLGGSREATKSPLDAADLRSLMAEELKKNKITVEEMIVIKDMELRKDAGRPFSPTKELLEMIQHANGVRSPPPVPPPKPHTPSHSRPQSPVVKKLSTPVMVSTISTEQKMFAERQNKPNTPIQKAYSQDSGDNELSALLERRTKILQGESVPEMINKKLSLYAEFSEFSRKQIKFFTDTFKTYDEDADGFIDFDELKRMMEKLGEAQTHIALKEIIRRVDEDRDGKISLREFFLIFRLSAQNQLGCSEVFQQLADSVDVSKEGVLGAASFFQAKIEEQTKLSKFEQEMKEEVEERKRLEEEKKARREKFLQNKSIFQ
ncbi:hypothetical protein Q1695_013014 [Nippostrongylus brasiliensis]|nr:hypothetical protein Q1695_013014 [Nippostrongylus brasiliensis]